MILRADLLISSATKRVGPVAGWMRGAWEMVSGRFGYIDVGKFAFGDRTIPLHARTLGPDEHNSNEMGVYYGTVQTTVCSGAH